MAPRKKPAKKKVAPKKKTTKKTKAKAKGGLVIGTDSKAKTAPMVKDIVPPATAPPKKKVDFMQQKAELEAKIRAGQASSLPSRPKLLK